MADSIIGGASLPESPNPQAEGQGTPKPNAGRVPAQKSLAALRKGAEACRVMLAAIEAHARIVCVPASDSDADMQAAYAPRYAGTDVAVAAALDQYAHDDGFRRALGTYLLQVAEGAWDSPSATTADDLLTDSGNRSQPAPVEPAGGKDLTQARDKASFHAACEISATAAMLRNQEGTEEAGLSIIAPAQLMPALLDAAFDLAHLGAVVGVFSRPESHHAIAYALREWALATPRETRS